MHVFATYLVSAGQTIDFNLRTGGSKNKIGENVTFSLLPVHVGLVAPEKTDAARGQDRDSSVRLSLRIWRWPGGGGAPL